MDTQSLPINATERVLSLKDCFLDTMPEMCCNRALIYTETYRNAPADMPTVLLRAKALRRTLEELPIFMLPGEVIVGHCASRPRSAEVFPEINISVVDEIDRFETREYNRLRVRPEVKKSLLEIAPFWRNKTPHDYLSNERGKESKDSFACGLLSNPHEWSGFAHVAMDYRKILHLGVEGLLESVEKIREILRRDDPDYEQKLAFCRAEKEICLGLLSFASRYRELILEQSSIEKNVARKAELEGMALALEQVPRRPARTFHEALQSVWFLQLLPQIEANGFSISLGRFDQYCYPYLRDDLNSGRLTVEAAQELLDLFWLRFCEVLRVDSRGAAEVNAGYASGQNLEVGGIDENGNDCTNLLSYMCLMANRHIKMNQPNFTVRLHGKTPQDFLDAVVLSIGAGNGMPQLVNDECIIPGLVDSGMPLAEAREYIAVGCDEISVHRHWARCNGGYINLAKILELTLGNGTDLKYGIKLFDAWEEPHTFDEFMEQFRSYMRRGIALQVEEANLTDMVHKRILPLPAISLFLDDCVAVSRDCTDSGAHYNTTGLVAVGAATVADSLYAVKKIVYDEKKLSLRQFVEILQKNFEGEEVLRQYIVQRLPKFGNDIDEVDQIVKEITELFADELKKYKNSRGGEFWPALYSVSAQVGLGNACGATPDGRRDALPLSDGLTPMYGMDRKGPTAALASLAKINHRRFLNGIIINQRMTGALFNSADGRRKIAQLLRAFVATGNFHWQFNIVDNKELLAAQEKPELYRDLVVRVAGYSAVFIELSLKAQNSIIERYASDL